MADIVQPDVAALTVQLLSAYLANNTVEHTDIAELIRSTRAALLEDKAPEAAPEVAVHSPAVTARKSLASPDHIISLIDGKSYKTLKRHLSGHGLTPQTYRERYGLAASYPMVAPTFAAERRAIAQKIGLGRRSKKSVQSEPANNEPPVTEPEAKAPVSVPEVKATVSEPEAKAATTAKPVAPARAPKVPAAKAAKAAKPARKTPAKSASNDPFSEGIKAVLQGSKPVDVDAASVEAPAGSAKTPAPRRGRPKLSLFDAKDKPTKAPRAKAAVPA